MTFDAALTNRRGATSPSRVSATIRDALERGLPSVNHMEQMAIDMVALFENSLPGLPISSSALQMLTSPKFITRLRGGGQAILDSGNPELLKVASVHPSDSVRGWAAFASAEQAAWNIDSLVTALLPFAGDDHFAVREWAWLSARPAAVLFTHEFVSRVTPLTLSDDQNLRRFASESTRPRGVWSTHIPALVEDPSSAIALLGNLVRDNSRYVQLSVGNWLNDAAKSRPAWVLEQIDRWEQYGPIPKTIRSRGIRSL